MKDLFPTPTEFVKDGMVIDEHQTNCVKFDKNNGCSLNKKSKVQNYSMKVPVKIKTFGTVKRNNANKKPNERFDRFICDLCHKFYKTKENLLRHMQDTHINEIIRQYPDSRCCSFCKKFFLKEHYQDHIKQKHKRIQCDTCEKVFFSIRSFRQHRKWHGSTRYSCDLCNYKSVCKYRLEMHIVAVHLRRPPRSKCEHCGKMIISHVLKKHINSVHKKVRDYRCDVCAKWFDKKHSLQDHLAWAHLKEENHVCTICNKKFAAKPNLKRHYDRVHNAKEQIKCKKCERKFTRIGSYHKHLKRHETYPFACTRLECRKMFITEQARDTHVSFYHTNRKGYLTKTYPCDQCDKVYRGRDKLDIHVRTQHLGLRHECHFCGKQYLERQSLIVHLFKHHIEKQ